MRQVIKLGVRVRDRVTGFTGIAHQRTEMFGGTVQYGLQPDMDTVTAKDKYPESWSVDVEQLEVIDATQVVPAVAPVPHDIVPGNKVEDIVSGFKGFAMSRTTFVNGCVYFTVEGAMNPKEPTQVVSRFFAVQRLKKTGKGIAQTAEHDDLPPPGTGGPAMPSPRRT